VSALIGGSIFLRNKPFDTLFDPINRDQVGAFVRDRENGVEYASSYGNVQTHIQERQRNMVLKIKRLTSDAILPQYAHPGDAGLDLFANEHADIGPGDSGMVKTGISIELPKGTEAQVRPRSGLAAKHAITVLNTPGTIDEGYRGEVCVILINHGKKPFVVEKGMKIAQMVIAPVLTVNVEEAKDLSDTSRGTGGFGSTGNGKR